MGKITALRRLARPMPPGPLLDGPLDQFMPAPEIEAWARAAFVAEDAALVNEDHAHLRMASICFLWTNVPNARRGRRVVGQAERGYANGTAPLTAPLSRFVQLLSNGGREVDDQDEPREGAPKGEA